MLTTLVGLDRGGLLYVLLITLDLVMEAPYAVLIGVLYVYHRIRRI
jgi:hypothetical protein